MTQTASSGIGDAPAARAVLARGTGFSFCMLSDCARFIGIRKLRLGPRVSWCSRCRQRAKMMTAAEVAAKFSPATTWWNQ